MNQLWTQSQMKPFSLEDISEFGEFDYFLYLNFRLWRLDFCAWSWERSQEAYFISWIVLSLATCSRFILIINRLTDWERVMTVNEYLQWNSVQFIDTSHLTCLHKASGVWQFYKSQISNCYLRKNVHDIPATPWQFWWHRDVGDWPNMSPTSYRGVPHKTVSFGYKLTQIRVQYLV